ncbi:GPW/gp25 family protein [Ochrobactrum chromiisoli]|uniref:GPW/gp25 family protein n=1 Tax=Ochrobactrum chromiisoli TaxID=2993941 RepID=A0ABT3QLA6_9HYPH|nr:GPW/gp25 family protein [Ochrobactrum chromiisoli]MCX2696393.1 GPW/gp25 family protein [Ochrobactrum chromiisoli]
MSSIGFSNVDGSLLTGFDHVRQSIEVILNTPIGSRVMRRDFGSELMALIDRPSNDQIILSIYSACATAIAKWEPRFALTGISIGDLTVQGAVSLQISGIYYPNGHKGDFSVTEGETSTSITITRTMS